MFNWSGFFANYLLFLMSQNVTLVNFQFSNAKKAFLLSKYFILWLKFECFHNSCTYVEIFILFFLLKIAMNVVLILYQLCPDGAHCSSVPLNIKKYIYFCSLMNQKIEIWRRKNSELVFADTSMQPFRLRWKIFAN